MERRIETMSNKNLENIEQMRKDTLAQMPEKTRRILEVVQRDCRIIEKNMEKRIHPKSTFDLSDKEHEKMFFEELNKMNLKGNARFN